MMLPRSNLSLFTTCISLIGLGQICGVFSSTLGALGQDQRLDVARYDGSSGSTRSPLHQLGTVQMTVQNVARQRSGCCAACKTNLPSTQMTMFFKAHGNPTATCSCLTHPFWNHPYRFKLPELYNVSGITECIRQFGSGCRLTGAVMLTGACGSQSIEIDGYPLGAGIWVKIDTVNYLGSLDSPSRGVSCCEECRQRYPATRMFKYGSSESYLGGSHYVGPNWKGCFCYSPKSGQRPITHVEEQFSAACGCNGLTNGITCCSSGFTRGDSVDTSNYAYQRTSEVFIQAHQYQSTCEETCKSLHPRSTGITESLKQTYTSGNGANKNKCWCEFGDWQMLDYSNMDYQTCVFRK